MDDNRQVTHPDQNLGLAFLSLDIRHTADGRNPFRTT